MRIASVFAAFAVALLAAPIPAVYADFYGHKAAFSQAAACDPAVGVYDNGPFCPSGSGPSAICVRK